MAEKQSNKLGSKGIVLGLLLVVSIGSIVAFRAGLFAVSTSWQMGAHSRELVDMVAIKGTVREKHLKFSGKEIRDINYAVLKHKTVFPKVDIFLDMNDKTAPVRVEKDTLLDLTMAFGVSEDAEVRCWTRTVSRRGLVPDMVRTMDKVAREFRHYRDVDGVQGFKRFYM